MVFKIAVVRHLGIFKFEILFADKVKRVNMRHHAKFREGRSNRYEDIPIFRLSKWRQSILIVCRLKKVKMCHFTKFCLLLRYIDF